MNKSVHKSGFCNPFQKLIWINFLKCLQAENPLQSVYEDRKHSKMNLPGYMSSVPQ